MVPPLWASKRVDCSASRVAEAVVMTDSSVAALLGCTTEAAAVVDRGSVAGIGCCHNSIADTWDILVCFALRMRCYLESCYVLSSAYTSSSLALLVRSATGAQLGRNSKLRNRSAERRTAEGTLKNFRHTLGIRYKDTDSSCFSEVATHRARLGPL